MFFGGIHLIGRLFKVAVLSFHDILEDLRIAVDQGEPGALYLHHNAVPFFKGVQYVLQLKINRAYFTGYK